MSTAPRTLYFDLDGTLLDSLPGIEAAARLALAEIDPAQELPPLRSLLGPSFLEVLRRALPRLDASALERITARYRERYDGGAWRQTRLFPGVRETLLELERRRIDRVVLSNKPIRPARLILEALGVAPLFQALLCPDVTHPPVPAKAERLACHLRATGLEPAACLLVGDAADDADAAERTGVPFAAAAYGYGEVHRVAGVRSVATLGSFPALLDLIDARDLPRSTCAEVQE